MLLAFCSRSVRRPRRSARPVRPPRYRLGVEALEVRCVPSTVTTLADDGHDVCFGC